MTNISLVGLRKPAETQITLPDHAPQETFDYLVNLCRTICTLVKQMEAGRATDGMIAVWGREYGLDEVMSHEKMREAYEAARGVNNLKGRY